MREGGDRADKSGEDIWQLPMFDFYSELLKSDVADVKNVGGRWAGDHCSEIPGEICRRQTLGPSDIAGPAFASSAKPYREGGATGCLVRDAGGVGTRVGNEWAMRDSNPTSTV